MKTSSNTRAIPQRWLAGVSGLLAGAAEAAPHPDIEPGMLDQILKESAEEVASLIRALKG